MGAWLEAAGDHDTNASHWSPVAFRPSFATREMARLQIAATANGEELLGYERPPHAGELEEPPALYGLV